MVEVAGRAKQGASFGYTKRRGYHPILATRADTGEVLHARMRKGSAQSQRGAERFVRELVQRVRRLGATGPLLVRADSGFWSNKTIAALEQHGVRYSIGVTQQESVRRTIERIPEQSWQPLDDYPSEGIAEIAEGTLGQRRLVVRRTRLVGAQAELFPDWRYHALLLRSPSEREAPANWLFFGFCARHIGTATDFGSRCSTTAGRGEPYRRASVVAFEPKGDTRVAASSPPAWEFRRLRAQYHR